MSAAEPTMGLIDEYMPTAEVASRHTTWVAATPARVARALRAADLGRPWLVRGLMALRTLPAFLAHPRGGWRRCVTPPPFTVLADTADELVLGLQGRFWTATGELVEIDARTFAAGPPPGLAQAVWGFRVRAEQRGTRLTTETRVRTGDPATGRAFRRYWRVVGPFSGLMRRRMLALVRREAESAGHGG